MDSRQDPGADPREDKTRPASPDAAPVPPEPCSPAPPGGGRTPDPAELDTMISTPPAPGGEWIAGYRIIRKLGEGGMGVVYEAEQQVPRRRVALKLLRGGAAIESQLVRLFQREVQSLALLKHPGIAAIYDAGNTEDGRHY
jgi:serine/threonine protein kinase